MMFALGNRMPRITCARVPTGLLEEGALAATAFLGEGACAATAAPRATIAAKKSDARTTRDTRMMHSTCVEMVARIRRRRSIGIYPAVPDCSRALRISNESCVSHEWPQQVSEMLAVDCRIFGRFVREPAIFSSGTRHCTHFDRICHHFLGSISAFHLLGESHHDVDPRRIPSVHVLVPLTATEKRQRERDR